MSDRRPTNSGPSSTVVYLACILPMLPPGFIF